jgi:oligopeptide transport system substrate-binding protein
MKSLSSLKLHFLVCLMGAIACLSSASAATHPVSGEKLAAEQVFTYRMAAEPPSIDPQLVEDVEGSAVARDLFEGLLTQKADGSLAPGVAERWELNPAKTIYTFHLRKNARWSNGDAVTAHDFVYAWRRAVDPKLASPYAGYLELTTLKNVGAVIRGERPTSALGVTAIDDYTLQAELDAPLAYFPTMLVHATTMPTPRRVIEQHGDNWTRAGNLVGNGAYLLTEHVLNERMVRVRNPLYWNNQQTILDKVIGLIINDESQAYNRYQANELDKTEVPTGQFRRLQKERPLETFSSPRLCSYYYMFNLNKAPFDDQRVRQALSYAIDRDIITNNILGAGQIPAYTFTPGSTANFSVPDVALASMSRNDRIKTASALLAEAGYGPSRPLKTTIFYNTSEGHKKIAIAISQMWKQRLGVQVTLQNQEWKTFLSTRGSGDFEIARGAWCGDYNEASTFLDLMRSGSDQNDMRYKNERIDQLLAEARTLADPNPNYTEIENIIAAEAPIIPIYHYTGVMLLKPYVKGWPHQNVEANWYAREMYITEH